MTVSGELSATTALTIEMPESLATALALGEVLTCTIHTLL